MNTDTLHKVHSDMLKDDKSKSYIEAVGRRKTAVARVRLLPSAKAAVTINNKEVAVYFPTKELQHITEEAFHEAKIAPKFKITAIVKGGGINAQAEAVRHAIARALVIYDAEVRKKVKKAGFLKRDPRVKERRKFGLKKARKSPQWSKR